MLYSVSDASVRTGALDIGKELVSDAAAALKKAFYPA